MRTLRKGRLARALASMLLVIFAGPVLGWGLALPASAQLTTQTQMESVAVVPILNRTAIQSLPSLGEPKELAARAREEVNRQLLATQVYDVTALSETDTKMTELGLRSPLDEQSFDRLGAPAALGVDGIVFGEIRSAGIERLGASRRGMVVLMLAIYDLPTRTLRAGTITRATSSLALADSSVSDETLIDEAVNQAVDQAIRDIRSHRPLTGIVQWSQGKDVTINIGEPQGVKESMQFVVLRDGARIGIIEITNSDRNFSDAHLLQGEARTDDSIREVFRIPASGASAQLPGVQAKQKRNRWTIVWAVVTAAAIAGLASPAGGTAGTPGGLTAAAISNITELSIPKSADPNAAPAIISDPNGGAIQLRWGRSSSDVLAGYEILRDGMLYWFVPKNGGAGSATGSSFTSPTPANSLTITITVGDPASSAYGIPVVDWLFDVPSNTGTAQPSVTGEGTEAVAYFFPGDWNIADDILFYTGPLSGTHHTFQVRRVVASPVQVEGARNFVITRETGATTFQTASYIAPAILLVPANGDPVPNPPTAVTFGFNGVAGADIYVLQLSLSTAFSPSATKTIPLPQITGLHSPTEALFITQNLVSSLGTLPSGTPVYWRIGTRYSGDTNAPQPFPFKNVSGNFRHVFSRIGRVVVQ
jgi:hypothetical protein